MYITGYRRFAGTYMDLFNFAIGTYYTSTWANEGISALYGCLQDNLNTEYYCLLQIGGNYNEWKNSCGAFKWHIHYLNSTTRSFGQGCAIRIINFNRLYSTST